MGEVDRNYTKYYRDKAPENVYPVEFVVRTFLARYPRLALDRSRYQGARILDLGFGDGRNTEFLCQQGFSVCGTEITEEIVAGVAARMRAKGFEADLRVGRNNRLPFEDGYFDYILACHSCYYIDPEDSFEINLAEIARVMKVDGVFVASIPKTSNYYYKDAERLPDSTFIIRKDPYGLRVGQRVAGFESPEDIEKRLSPFFRDFSFGCCLDDFYGLQQDVFILVCRKRAAEEKKGG